MAVRSATEARLPQCTPRTRRRSPPPLSVAADPVLPGVDVVPIVSPKNLPFFLIILYGVGSLCSGTAQIIASHS